jgi:hypothetical protein
MGEMIEETFKMASYGSQGDKASNEAVQDAITSLNTGAVHTYKSVMRSEMTLVEISERMSRMDNEIVVQENHILMKQVISDMRSLILRWDIGLTTNDLSASSKRPRANVEEIESSAMDVLAVESTVTPQNDLQSHAQIRIHQNVFDTMMTASSVRTGTIVINKDTTILQLLQHCVERLCHAKLSIVQKDENGTSLLLDFAFKFMSSEQIAQVKAFKFTNNIPQILLAL